MANPLKFPVPLGLLIGGATYATVAVSLAANVASLALPDGQAYAGPYNEINVQTPSTNLLPVYVLVPLSGQSSTAIADTTNYTNVIAIIPAGSSWSRYDNPGFSNKWYLTDYYLSFGNATDIAIGNAGRL